MQMRQDNTAAASMHQHYRDYSGATDPTPDHTSKDDNKIKEHTFPAKLHYVLSEMEKDGLENIISWQPHGRAFIVRDTRGFEKQYLPLWFRQTKIASFQRQLNIYGFTRITNGIDKGCYYHELFLRGKSFLAKKIYRRKTGPSGRREHVDKMPNLYYELQYLPLHEDSTTRMSNAAVVSPTEHSTPHDAGPGPVLYSSTRVPAFALPGVPSRMPLLEAPFGGSESAAAAAVLMSRRNEQLAHLSQASTSLLQPRLSYGANGLFLPSFRGANARSYYAALSEQQHSSLLSMTRGSDLLARAALEERIRYGS